MDAIPMIGHKRHGPAVRRIEVLLEDDLTVVVVIVKIGLQSSIGLHSRFISSLKLCDLHLQSVEVGR